MKKIKEFVCWIIGHDTRSLKSLEICLRCDALFYKRIVELRHTEYGEIIMYQLERII